MSLFDDNQSDNGSSNTTTVQTPNVPTPPTPPGAASDTIITHGLQTPGRVFITDDRIKE